MTGFNARTGLEELEEYAVEHVAADIIVNANESNYNLPRPIEQAVAAKLAGFLTVIRRCRLKRCAG